MGNQSSKVDGKFPSATKYQQLADKLRKEILASGPDRSPFRLPPYKELMDSFGVSLSTVRQALELLKNEGLVLTRRGAGTFAYPGARAGAEITGESSILLGRLNVVLPSETPASLRGNPSNWLPVDDYLRGIAAAAQDMGLLANLITIPDNSEPLIEPQSRGASVLIFPRAQVCIRSIEALHHKGIPCISISPPWNLPGHSITVETETASWEAVRALVRTRRRPAFLRGKLDDPYQQGRIRGYRKALQEAGVSYRPELVKECDGSIEAGYIAMQDLLRLPQPPDALFAATDLRAYGAIRAIQEMGLRIPDDVAIAGFDDLPESRLLSPPLASVRFPRVEAGRAAVELAHQLLRGDEARATVMMHAKYVSRVSDGQEISDEEPLLTKECSYVTT